LRKDNCGFGHNRRFGWSATIAQRNLICVQRTNNVTKTSIKAGQENGR
jgi:hypothetical protein